MHVVIGGTFQQSYHGSMLLSHFQLILKFYVVFLPKNTFLQKIDFSNPVVLTFQNSSVPVLPQRSFRHPKCSTHLPTRTTPRTLLPTKTHANTSDTRKHRSCTSCHPLATGTHLTSFQSECRKIKKMMIKLTRVSTGATNFTRLKFCAFSQRESTRRTHYRM